MVVPLWGDALAPYDLSPLPRVETGGHRAQVRLGPPRWRGEEEMFPSKAHLSHPNRGLWVPLPWHTHMAFCLHQSFRHNPQGQDTLWGCLRPGLPLGRASLGGRQAGAGQVREGKWEPLPSGAAWRWAHPREVRVLERRYGKGAPGRALAYLRWQLPRGWRRRNCGQQGEEKEPELKGLDACLRG